MPLLRALLILLLFASVTWADHEVRTLSGKTIKGTVTAITSTDVTVQTGDGKVETPLASVLAIDLRPVAKLGTRVGYTLVRLIDDSQLRCSKVTFKGDKKGDKEGDKVDVTLLSGQTAEIPLASIVYVLKEAQDQDMKVRWEKLLSTKVRRDRLVILKDSELNPLEGTFGDVDAQGKNIEFTPEAGKTVSVGIDRAHALVFYRTEAPKDAPVCQVIDVQGNSLAAVKVAVVGDAFEVTLAVGAKIRFDEKNLARLDYNMGKLTYLSDMDPAKVVERSGAGLINRYRRDVNLEGERIYLANVEYPKGLSMHAYTELEYDLGGKFKDFKALLGVDPRVGSESNALVTIECDGQKRFSKTVDAKTPLPLALNVREVQKLRIIVSSDNFLDLHDHATLAEARVSQ